MRTSFGSAGDGRTNPSGVPRNPLELGLLMQPADVFLPGVPVPAQKAIFGALASAARHLGYEARSRGNAAHVTRESGASVTSGASGRTLFQKAHGVASREVDGRARGLAFVVGWISLGMGLALTLAPRASAASLGWGGRVRLARAVGVADLIVGPALLWGRSRARWMLVRALMNAVLSAVYAWVLAIDTPRPGRALGGAVGMSALAVTDYLLARRLASVERDGPAPGEQGNGSNGS